MKNIQKAIAGGLRWVCDDWPRDSSPWRRWLRKLSSSGRHSKQNDALRGWGWTPGTSSWVEPTAFALLALESQPAAGLPGNAEERRELGEALLYDRMCRGRRLELRKSRGVWRCGRTAGDSDDVGVAGFAAASGAPRKYRESRVDGEKLREDSGAGFVCAGADLPFGLRAQSEMKMPAARAIITPRTNRCKACRWRRG